ncbi:hypothetical protein D3C87_1104070 [compost metagenome]
MVHVGGFASRCGEGLQPKEDAASEVRIGFHDGFDRRQRCVVGRRDDEPGDAPVGTELVEIAVDGMGEHHRPRCIVDALADNQLAIGADLKPLVQRLGLDRQHGLDGGALRPGDRCQQLGFALGE